MNSKRDYYEVLGVSKDATDDELRTAYRKLAMKWHPDRCKDPDAKDKFAEISEAYDVLHDKEKRARYDQFGFEGCSTQGGFPFEGINPFEMFKKHFGHFGIDDDDVDEFFRSRRQSSKPDFNAPEDGNDLQIQTSLSFKESYAGCEKTIKITLADECPECHGTGIEKGTEPKTCDGCNGSGHISHVERHGFMMSQTVMACPKCHGTGVIAKPCERCGGNKRIDAKKEIVVKVPRGINDGQNLRVKGKGLCGVKGGKDGDLYIAVHIQPNELFKRNGLDLMTAAPVDAVTATFGGKTSVNAPDGSVEINVPAGTTSGKTVTLPGHGMKLDNGKTGDLIVMFNIMPFINLDDKQKELLQQFQASLKRSNIRSAEAYDKKLDDVMK